MHRAPAAMGAIVRFGGAGAPAGPARAGRRRCVLLGQAVVVAVRVALTLVTLGLGGRLLLHRLAERGEVVREVPTAWAMTSMLVSNAFIEMFFRSSQAVW